MMLRKCCCNCEYYDCDTGEDCDGEDDVELNYCDEYVETHFTSSNLRIYDKEDTE
jgi:hypothetical protein